VGAVPSNALPPAAGGPEITGQLATRISPELDAILDYAVQREKSKRGPKASKRTLIEETILAQLGLTRATRTVIHMDEISRRR
jgi:hypothetical protein